MRELVLDGAKWECRDDIYTSFFEAVGAPKWHGRNFDALNDSIAAGQINQIEVPYVIKIINYSAIGVGAKKMAADFVDLIKKLREKSCPVDVVVCD